MSYTFIGLPPLQAQDLIGEIEIEEGKQERSPYKIAQDAVIDNIKQIVTAIKEGGGFSRPAPLEKVSHQYLASVYLYCTLQRGACPVILDALLESEIVNSALSSQVSCPNMRGLWKAYIGADMERRVEYSLKVGYIAKAEEFKKKKRGRYIKCKKTIAELLNGAGFTSSSFSPQSFLTKTL